MKARKKGVHTFPRLYMSEWSSFIWQARRFVDYSDQSKILLPIHSKPTQKISQTMVLTWNSHDVCIWIDAGAPAEQAAVSKVMGDVLGIGSCSESAAVVGYC